MRGNRLAPGKRRILLNLDRKLIRRIAHMMIDSQMSQTEVITGLLEIAVREVELDQTNFRGKLA